MTLQILHLDDSPDDAELLRLALSRSGLDCHINTVSDRKSFLSALESRRFDVILSDSGIPGYDGTAAMHAAHERCPQVPFIVVSGHIDERKIPHPDHARARILKSDLTRVAPAIHEALRQAAPESRKLPEREFR